jgi:hypothetical protein
LDLRYLWWKTLFLAGEQGGLLLQGETLSSMLLVISITLTYHHNSGRARGILIWSNYMLKDIIAVRPLAGYQLYLIDIYEPSMAIQNQS